MKPIRVATRKSPLAQWQADNAIRLLSEKLPGRSFEKILIVSEGDKILDKPLSLIGGKGLFLKELEESLLRGEADIAVHSMKDVPVKLSSLFVLPAVLERENPLDAFVSNDYSKLEQLPAGAVVGSSSLRRVYQMRKARPDLTFKDLRGNINTRLKKLDSGEYSAIILAAAGLERLGLNNRIQAMLQPEICIPAAAQGVVCIETTSDNTEAQSIASLVEHAPTRFIAESERLFLQIAEGDCRIPIGCHISPAASGATDEFEVRCMLGRTDSPNFISHKETLHLSRLRLRIKELATDMLQNL